MQFNREMEKYSTKIHREVIGNTLEISLKQKDITASELNAQVKKFTDENGIDELDSNSVQLVTEELVIMVLLPKLKDGMTMQYFISHVPAEGVIKMGVGYPGESYNPFEQEDNIFMINIFKEWISDIKFENADNSFNELVLTMKATEPQEQPGQKQQNPQAELVELEQILQEQDESTASEAANGAANSDVFSFDGYQVGDKTVAPGAIAENFRKTEKQIWEILIRDKTLDGNKWYEYLDKFLEKINISAARVVFDSTVNKAESAIKSVSKVLLADIMEHCMQRFAYVACRAAYTKGDGEFALRFRYPGEEYNPFIHNLDGRGIKIISRQPNVIILHYYREQINEMIVIFKFVK